ncbi:MAG: putative signal transducing protein [Candidatus Rokuibacteriota bacterium]
MAARRAKIIRFPTRPPKAPAPGHPATELVEACRCRDQTEALVVRGLLESEGIAVVLRSRIAPSVYPFSVGHQAEVLLLVAGADLPRARAVLARER